VERLRLIYTTNAIEGFNRQLRKVTKIKTVFPSDDSLLKMLYLATMDITKKWTGHGARLGADSLPAGNLF
jgi:putative transposase